MYVYKIRCLGFNNLLDKRDTIWFYMLYDLCVSHHFDVACFCCPMYVNSDMFLVDDSTTTPDSIFILILYVRC